MSAPDPLQAKLVEMRDHLSSAWRIADDFGNRFPEPVRSAISGDLGMKYELQGMVRRLTNAQLFLDRP